MVRKLYKRKMVLLTVHLTIQQLKSLDELVKRNIFPSRSEAIRVAIRDLIDKYSSISKSKTELTMGL